MIDGSWRCTPARRHFLFRQCFPCCVGVFAVVVCLRECLNRVSNCHPVLDHLLLLFLLRSRMFPGASFHTILTWPS
jgi:hypothetical protein